MWIISAGPSVAFQVNHERSHLVHPEGKKDQKQRLHQLGPVPAGNELVESEQIEEYSNRKKNIANEKTLGAAPEPVFHPPDDARRKHDAAQGQSQQEVIEKFFEAHRRKFK